MNDKNKKPVNRSIILFITGFIFLVFIALASTNGKIKKPTMSYSNLLLAIDKGNVKAIELHNNTYPKKALVKLKSDNQTHEVTLLETNDTLIDKMTYNKIHFRVAEEKINQYSLIGLIIAVLMILLVIIVLPNVFPTAKDGVQTLFGMNNNRNTQEKPNVTFSDICGIDRVKEEVLEVVDFLRNPKKFTSLGAKLPKGLLFTGDPGVGKTMIAKAIANEAGANFIESSGSSFMEMFVGVGAKRVRDLFDAARQQKPVVIFIDEIDAIGMKRASGYGGSHREADQTLNQLLVEMDGFSSSEGIVVIGATNRADVLDPALLRAGRFDRKIFVPRPSLEGRREILFKGLEKVMVDPNGINTEHSAKVGYNLVGADLMNIINEAIIKAVKKGEPYMTTEDLNEATEEAIMGKKSIISTSEEDRRRVAIHEAGHALMIHFLTDPSNPSANPDPIFKATMIPRGRALGYVWFFPQSDHDRATVTKAYILNIIAVFFGGRVAEELEYGIDNAGGGAIGDIEHMTQFALDMICKYGFTEGLGHINPTVLIRENFHGSVVQDIVIQEARRILDEQYERARTILSAHKKELLLVAEAMLEQDLTGPQVVEIIESGNLDNFKAQIHAEKERYIFKGGLEKKDVGPKEPEEGPPVSGNRVNL